MKQLYIATIALLAGTAVARINFDSLFAPKRAQRTHQVRHVERGDFDQMVKAWADDARTNRTVETSARFRDEVVVPFVRREMPNPFLQGGCEADKPWAREANEVYEAGLRIVCDEYPSAWYPDHLVCKRANKLVAQGCKEPFILLLSAFDPDIGWYVNRKRAAERLQVAEKAVEGREHAGFFQMLLCYYRKLASVKREDDRTADRFVDWLRERGFSKDDEPAIVWLVNALAYNRTVFDSFDQLKWMSRRDAAIRVMNEGRSAAGQGVRSTVSQSGWQTLGQMTQAALDILDDAERIQPGHVETLQTRLWMEGESRRGNAARMDELFLTAAHIRLDCSDLFEHYIWHRLYPRWSGSADYQEMRSFAQACYDTGRHDTLLPYYYAELQCRYVRDSNTDPFRHFKEHSDITDRCIDACLRQTTNAFASCHARLNAPFIGAAIAFYSGRYEQVATFTRHFYRLNGDPLDMLFPDKEWLEHVVNALGGDDSNRCIRIQRLYDAQRYREALAEIEKVPRNPKEYCETDHFCAIVAQNARMKTDFVEGKDIKGRIPPYFPGWRNYGWFRSGHWCFDTMWKFSWEHHLTWWAELPKVHELEFMLTAKPKTEGRRHVLVVSRFVHEETHYRPLNGLPFVTFLWEKGRTGVYISNDYRAMFKIDPSAAVWTETEDAERRVRIVCDDSSIKIFLGNTDKPVVETSRYATAIRRSPEPCYARFRGENVRITGITARKPR